MAKIKKEKFYITGMYMKDKTTYTGEVELMLHYDADGDFFFFQMEELRSVFGEDYKYPNFNKCKNKSDAIELIQFLFADNLVETKFLKLDISIPSRLFKIENTSSGYLSDKFIDDESLPTHIREMFSDVYKNHGITMSVIRVMRVELNGCARYVHCNDNWEYERTYSSKNVSGLIEWSADIESFLTEMKSQMDIMSNKVLQFFSVPTVDDLKIKMETGGKFLLENN